MRYVVDATKKKAEIDKNIYGHFSEHLGRCIYEGIYVGEDSGVENIDGVRVDVLEALRKMKLPVLRWPGGCFADEYHWKDGIGPKENRKKMINTNWGGVVEDNSFGTHEFLHLCELIGCEPYINGNVGSGTVQEMSEWMEYMTFDGMSPMATLREQNGKKEAWKIKYFGIGNENWGCGGNMRPEYYADLFRHYGTYVRNYGKNKVFKIACGANSDDYNWTEVLMKVAGKFMDGLSLHYYTIPTGNWDDKGNATGFDEESYYKTLKKTLFMEELIHEHSAIMDRYDPDKKIALLVDEWGTWYNVEEGTNPGFLYQQNSMRDAMVAAINLNIFNKHADRVKMANIAQVVNVLQAVILTEGAKMLLTPTYYVFEMLGAHQGNQLLDSFLASGTTGTEDVTIPDVLESASMDENGNVVMTLCNVDAHTAKTIDLELLGLAVNNVSGEYISGEMGDHNTFDAPETVAKKEFKDLKVTANGLSLNVPPCSVVKLVVTPS
jgi:alpha-N-arabinofuranosidase